MPRVPPSLGIPVRGWEHRGEEEQRGGRDGGDAFSHCEELHWVVAGEHHLVVGGAPQVHSTPVTCYSSVPLRIDMHNKTKNGTLYPKSCDSESIIENYHFKNKCLNLIKKDVVLFRLY